MWLKEKIGNVVQLLNWSQGFTRLIFKNHWSWLDVYCKKFKFFECFGTSPFPELCSDMENMCFQGGGDEDNKLGRNTQKQRGKKVYF